MISTTHICCRTMLFHTVRRSGCHILTVNGLKQSKALAYRMTNTTLHNARNIGALARNYTSPSVSKQASLGQRSLQVDMQRRLCTHVHTHMNTHTRPYSQWCLRRTLHTNKASYTHQRACTGPSRLRIQGHRSINNNLDRIPKRYSTYGIKSHTERKHPLSDLRHIISKGGMLLLAITPVYVGSVLDRYNDYDPYSCMCVEGVCTCDKAHIEPMYRALSGIGQLIRSDTQAVDMVEDGVVKEIDQKEHVHDKRGTDLGHARSALVEVQLKWTQKVTRILKTLLRLIRLTIQLTPVVVLYPMAVTWPGKKSDGVADWWWSFLVWELERAGATAIKFGQWASTRRDLFSDACCDAMCRLHSDSK
ncbi:hypothetical protein SARC_01621, partial [Sphaeroforma arctica JP610]